MSNMSTWPLPEHPGAPRGTEQVLQWTNKELGEASAEKTRNEIKVRLATTVGVALGMMGTAEVVNIANDGKPGLGWFIFAGVVTYLAIRRVSVPIVQRYFLGKINGKYQAQTQAIERYNRAYMAQKPPTP